MQIEPELLALITGVIGALLALAYTWLKGKFSNLPDFVDVVDVAFSIVVAARENHDLQTSEEMLSWAMEKLQKYLDAKGIGKYFDARVLAEYALSILQGKFDFPS